MVSPSVYRSGKLHADTGFMARSGRDLVPHPAKPIAERASFTAVKELQEPIDAFIRIYNDKAEPFVWTKKKVRQRRFKGRRITLL
jgi:hypothetical protein